MSRGDAERSLSALTDRFDALLGEEEFFDRATSDVGNSISDAVSGADRYKDYYEGDVWLAGVDLDSARSALAGGDIRGARRFLTSAEEHIESARSSWRLYINASAEGGETAIDGGIGLGIAGITAVFPPLGLSLAANAGLMMVAADALSNDDNGNETREGPNEVANTEPVAAEAEEEGESESAAAEKPDLQCIAPDRMTGETADVSTDQCAQAAASESEDERIFEVLDGPVSDRAVQRQVETLVEEETRAISEWKPPVIEIPAPPAGGYRMRSREELIAYARAVLAEWKENPNAVHDYAEFLIDSEFLDASGADAAARHSAARYAWDRLAAKLKLLAPHGVDTIMAKLFQDYLRDYSEDFALLTDYLEGRGGNCEADSKIVTSAFAASGVKLKNSEVLASQAFFRHVQPVIYDRATGKIRKLISGAHVDFVQAPLYDPHILFHAFLKRQGTESPVTEDELLIPGVEVKPLLAGRLEDGQAADVNAGEDTNTNLSLPSSDILFSDAPNPEHAIRPSPYGRAATGGLGRRPRANLPDEWWEHFAHGLDFIGSDEYQGDVVFRTENLAQQYNNLSTPEAKREFLIHLLFEKLQPLFDSPEMKLGLRLLANPSEIRRIPPTDVLRAIDMFLDVAEMVEGASHYIQEVLPLPGTERQEFREKRTAIARFIQEKSPFLRFLVKTRKKFEARIEEHPAEFIVFLDRLSPERRSAAIDLLLRDPVSSEGVLTIAVPVVNSERIAGVIADPRQIGIKTVRPGYEPRHRPKPAEDGPRYDAEPVVVDLVFTDSDPDGINLPAGGSPQQDRPTVAAAGKPAEEDRAGQRGQRVARTEVAAERTRARYEISKDTMIDLILRFHRVSAGVAKRWTPALSRRFLRLNHDGRYDDQFLSSFDLLTVGRDGDQMRRIEFRYCNEFFPHRGSMQGEMEKMMKDGGEEGRSCRIEIPADLAEILEAIQKRRAEKLKSDNELVSAAAAQTPD